MKTTKISKENLHLVAEIQKLQDDTEAEHARIHSEAAEACQALHLQHKTQATVLFKRLGHAEGLGDIDVGDYSLEVTYLTEHGDAFLKDSQRANVMDYAGAEAIPMEIAAHPTRH